MQCFKHRTAGAVGICKSCGKGVCAECAADTGDGLACRDTCEERVLLLGRMVANNAKVMRTANAQTRSAGLMAVILGLVFLAFGGWGYLANQPTLMFLGALGAVFLVFGLVRLVGERYPTPED